MNTLEYIKFIKFFLSNENIFTSDGEDSIELKKLLMQYKSEISLYGNNTHLTDYLAIMILAEYAKSFLLPDKITTGQITLGNMISDNPNNCYSKEELMFRIPSKRVVVELYDKYTKLLDNPKNSYERSYINQRIATKWIGLMLDLGMVEPGDQIDANKEDIFNYITDKRLKDLFGIKTKELSLTDYIVKK